MTNEENDKRRLDENVKYIKSKICDHKGDKPYVFISYKSDDWEIVLRDIVYRLVKDYGLNVYFDGSFDLHNAAWFNQFQDNMENYKCKGVIAFFDDKYATSYATLMELLYSQTKKAAFGKHDEKGLPIVPIVLDRLTDIKGERGQKNTGLGVRTYEDGTANVNADNEMRLFSKAFEQLVERKILYETKDIWEPGEKLKAEVCSRMVQEIKSYKKINDNVYRPGMQLDDIVRTIKDAFGEEVFSSKAIDGEEKKKKTNIPVSFDEGCSSEQGKSKEYGTKLAYGENEGGDLVDGVLEIRYNATIAEVREAFSKSYVAGAFKSIREMMSDERGGKSYMDYVMAALLGGCNNVNMKSPIYQVNYYLYDIANGNKGEGNLGATWSWSSNCRKTVLGLDGSGQIPDLYNEYFNNISTDVRLEDIGQMFIKEEPDQFKVKKKKLILIALNRLSDFMYKEKIDKKDLYEVY